MNDSELDDMLNQWDAPPVPRGLRERISPASAPRSRFRLPSGMVFGLTAAAAMFLLVVGVASPQTFGLVPSARFNLLTETHEFKRDGSSTITEYRASTAHNGAEIILEQTFPDNAFMTIHQRFFNLMHRMLGLEHTAPASMASDCSYPEHAVLGTEVLLGYQTTRLRYTGPDSSDGRYTEWRAPQLDCIKMKTTWEKLVGGEFKLAEERRPMTVRINRPQ